MGIFNKLFRNSIVEKVENHDMDVDMVDDVQYWETIAYGWICDADSVEDRERAWARFVQAYPEHAAVICEDFWSRIHRTQWHHKHHHEHHHNPYC